MTSFTDEAILEMLAETDGNVWAATEVIVDSECAAGLYEGCSSELEMAWTEHEARVQRILDATGG